MEVTVHQHVAGLVGRQMLPVEQMAVGQEGAASVFQRQQGVVRHDREIQHHLVDLRVAVAPDAQGRQRAFIQQTNDLLGRVTVGQVVPGAVVQKIPHQDQPVRLFGLHPLQHLLTGAGRTVNIRRKQNFHASSSIPFSSKMTGQWSLPMI